MLAEMQISKFLGFILLDSGLLPVEGLNGFILIEWREKTFKLFYLSSSIEYYAIFGVNIYMKSNKNT